MSNNSQDIYRNIFSSRSEVARQRVMDNGGRFAYYTTAETAYLILKNQEIWMRSTAVMNDFMEVEHGIDCLVQAYNSIPGNELKAAMNACFPGVSSEFEKLFDSCLPTIKKHTYILSVSEHLPEEDKIGRLSMWRAYGGNTGVALIFNGDPMFRPSDALKAYSSPVVYHEQDDVDKEIKKIAEELRKHLDYIQQKGKQFLIDSMFEAFRLGAICTKHPAFKEEREWRVISTQILHNSERLKPVTEVIRGVPQLLLKLILQDIPEEGLYGLATPEFLDRILIGPCEHPEVIAASLINLLESLGVKNAGARVYITGVPLRLNQS